MRALESQVGQIATALQERQQGRLPSDTEVTKAHGKEQCSALTLRSGTQINVQDKFGGKRIDDSIPPTSEAEAEVQDGASKEKEREESTTSKPLEAVGQNATAKVPPVVEDERPRLHFLNH